MHSLMKKVTIAMSVSRCMVSALTKNEQQAQADAELALQAHEEYLSVQNFHLNALKRELKSFDDKQRRRMAGIPSDDDGQKEESRRRLSAMDDEELDAVIAEQEKNAEDARSVHRSLLGMVMGDDDVVQIAIDVDGAQQHQQEFDDHRGLLQMDAYELRDFILKSEENAFDARETKRRRMPSAGDTVKIATGNGEVRDATFVKDNGDVQFTVKLGNSGLNAGKEKSYAKVDVFHQISSAFAQVLKKNKKIFFDAEVTVKDKKEKPVSPPNRAKHTVFILDEDLHGDIITCHRAGDHENTILTINTKDNHIKAIWINYSY